MHTSRCLFWINIFTMLVWTAACFNPYLRDDAAADDQQAFDQLDYAAHKRSVEGSESAHSAAANRANLRHTRRTGGGGSRRNSARVSEDSAAAGDSASSTVDDQRQLSDFAHLSDDDITRALSRLSTTELRSLDYFMDEEIGGQHAMDKRETARRDADAEQDREEARQWRKTVSDGDGYDDYGEMDDGGEEAAGNSEKREHNAVHGGGGGGGGGGGRARERHDEEDDLHAMSKRMAAMGIGQVGMGGVSRDLFRRSSSFNQAADKHVQAKINLLREKQKRQMAGKHR